MALSDRRIIEAIDDGDIIIMPYDDRNLSTSSYDVTLGEHYYAASTGDWTYNMYSKGDTRLMWGDVQQAVLAKDILDEDELDGIDPNDKVILLQPGQTILAHTQEFIGGLNHITTMMKARSSMGRNFIEVCKCAGWGDVGYVNRWTMEITNNSQTHPIPLVVGRRIAQIIFFETGPIRGADYNASGKYGSTKSVEQMVKDWKPEDMIPKMWKDRDIKR